MSYAGGEAIQQCATIGCGNGCVQRLPTPTATAATTASPPAAAPSGAVITIGPFGGLMVLRAQCLLCSLLDGFFRQQVIILITDDEICTIIGFAPPPGTSFFDRDLKITRDHGR